MRQTVLIAKGEREVERLLAINSSAAKMAKGQRGVVTVNVVGVLQGNVSANLLRRNSDVLMSKGVSYDDGRSRGETCGVR